jgi:hypothetical protein
MPSYVYGIMVPLFITLLMIGNVLLAQWCLSACVLALSS